MFDLNHLSILKKGQSRSINWENRKGEKGMGGRAASDLGTARKGSPCIPEIKSGETVTLAEMDGPGTINHEGNGRYHLLPGELSSPGGEEWNGGFFQKDGEEFEVFY